ncbi:ABC transporter ATP-binding protein, partial [Roseibium denhamense]|nr:ABC transporter ATP-binding protein [Roseibium denhamense]
MIRLEHLTKCFRLKGDLRYIAKDVSLTIPRGE